MSSMASDMPGMTMTGSAPSSTANAPDPLSTADLRMGNESAQMDFLMALLDDTELQVISNTYATRFWYGVVVVIGLATLLNLFLRVRTSARQVLDSSSYLDRNSHLLAGLSLLPEVTKVDKESLPAHEVVS